MKLKQSSPEAQGVASGQIDAFIRALSRVPQMHGLVVVRHGAVIADAAWHPYRREIPHMLYSLSKSFASTAVGLAVHEGLLTVDDPVADHFPEDAPKKPSAHLAAMRVRHLLSMSTGHAEDATGATMRSRTHPYRAFLRIPVAHEPGTHFVYNSAATFMLATIVQRLTGQTLVDYLTPRLFGPLGIEPPVWDSDPNGVNFGGWGLYLRAMDIAKFGQLYLQRGKWGRSQLIPRDWIAEATRTLVDNGSNPILMTMLGSMNLVSITNLRGLIVDPGVSCVAHREIIVALKSRNPETADRAMQRHLGQTKERLVHAIRRRRVSDAVA